MENKNESDPQSQRADLQPKKPYEPPQVRSLGKMSDRTLGVGGSRRDPGHNNNTKLGAG
jgi:hypothetical protein